MVNQNGCVSKHRGTLTSDLDEIFSKEECSFIILNPEQLAKYQSNFKNPTPILSIDWIRDSVLENRYLNPEKYRIVPPKPSERLDHSNIGIQKFEMKDLESDLDRTEMCDKTCQYYKGLIFYLSKKLVEDKEIPKLKKLIFLGGGFVLPLLIQNVTHVIADTLTEEDLKELTKFRDVKIVSSQWLAYGYRYKTKVPEIEFSVTPSKSLAPSSSGIKIQPEKPKTNDNFGFPALDNKSRQLNQPSYPTKKEVTADPPKRKLPDSEILKDVLFLIDESEVTKRIADSLKNKICKNSGNIVTLEHLSKIPKNLKTKTILYVIFFDGYKVETFDQVKASSQNEIVVVSPRWVEYVLERKIFIDINELLKLKLIHLMPLRHKLKPLEGVKTYLEKGHLDPNESLALSSLLKVLGANVVNSKKEKYPPFTLGLI